MFYVQNAVHMNPINPSIFKAYDIRGVFPEEINEDTAYTIGRAFVEYFKVKEVAVGYDMRVSSPSMWESLTQGIADADALVVNLGRIGTEVMYFTVGKFELEAGIMITASHNPPQYNGMKMVTKGSVPVGADTGIYDFRDYVAKQNYEMLKKEIQVRDIEPYAPFRVAINDLVDLHELPKLKVVIDAGNGMGGEMIERMFIGTNLEIIPMYFEPDGTFPNHEANPTKEENVADLKKRVVAEKADLGIALDGDGDRAFFVDNEGEFSLGYFIICLLSKKVLDKYPGAKIVHENRLKWAIEDTVKAAGGVAVEYIAGHAYLKAKMREVDSVFGGETSSHFFYKDLYYADSSMLTIALLLELLKDSGKSLHQLLTEYKSKYFISGEINYEVEDASVTLEKVKSHFESEGFKIDELDGVAVDSDRDWRFSLRKSNTEPVVRLNVEGKSQNLVDEKVKEVEKLIQS
jgi:phosphomannomutase